MNEFSANPFEGGMPVPDGVRGWIRLWNGWDEITADLETMINNADVIEIKPEGMEALRLACDTLDLRCPPEPGLWFYPYAQTVLDPKLRWVKVSDLRTQLLLVLDDLNYAERLPYGGYRPPMKTPDWGQK